MELLKLNLDFNPKLVARLNSDLFLFSLLAIYINKNNPPIKYVADTSYALALMF